jgi:aryl-alcohol dehydrogenase-like predicted oxidoreductase
LQTDYIDLYQIHAWDASTPLKETLTTLNDLVRSGKVRYIGASNYNGWQLQKALDLSQHIGLERKYLE